MKKLSSDLMGAGEDILFKTSKEEREAFFAGPLWGDIEGVIEKWLIDTRDFLEDPSEGVTDIETHRARGRAEALRAFLQIEEYLLADK